MPPPRPADKALLDEAVDLLRRAGQRTLRWFREAELAVDHKHDDTPVTEADKVAERFLREEIERHHPDDAIHGEEEDDRPGSSGRRWIIDPIDGTKAFVHGVPLYSNLLAVEDDGEITIGVINLPALGETVYAGRGLGCWLNGEPARVSDVTDVERSYVTTSGLGNWPPGAIDATLAAGLHLQTWGDGFGYALVATGRLEAMIDMEASPWDLAPVPVILGEAGGRFTSIDGDAGFDRGSGLGTNGALHDELLALYQPFR